MPLVRRDLLARDRAATANRILASEHSPWEVNRWPPEFKHAESQAPERQL
jgi:hypothetical protein